LGASGRSVRVRDVTGVIGGSEEGVPGYWAFSVDIAQVWERELDEAEVPLTRKVALRAAMVMTPDRGGVFDVLSRMAGFRPPGGWRSSAHSRSAPTPSSCSRAGEPSPAC
jgi:hypothetical protein